MKKDERRSAKNIFFFCRSSSSEFHGASLSHALSPRSLTILPVHDRARVELHRCSPGRCASLRAVCVAIPYLSLHLCNLRFIADDYARMEVRVAGGGGGGGGGPSPSAIKRPLSIDVAPRRRPRYIRPIDAKHVVYSTRSLGREISSPFLRPPSIDFSLSIFSNRRTEEYIRT